MINIKRYCITVIFSLFIACFDNSLFSESRSYYFYEYNSEIFGKVKMEIAINDNGYQIFRINYRSEKQLVESAFDIDKISSYLNFLFDLGLDDVKLLKEFECLFLFEVAHQVKSSKFTSDEIILTLSSLQDNSNTEYKVIRMKLINKKLYRFMIELMIQPFTLSSP